MLQDEESNKYSIEKFIGFNQTEHSQFLAPGETQSAQNMDVRNGNLNVCKGYSRFIDTPLPTSVNDFTGEPVYTYVKTLMAFYKNCDSSEIINIPVTNGESIINKNGVASYLIAATNNGLYYWNGGAWEPLGDKLLLMSMDFDYVNYQKDSTELIIMANGKTVYKWDGITFAELGGSPPAFTSLALHYERLWGTGIAENPNQVAYSDDLNPENWAQTINDGGIMELPTWDGGVCIAVESIFDNIVVFKTRDIFRIYGTYPGEYQNKKVFTSTGAIAKRSIVNAVTVAFFLSSDGIYAYNGSQTQLISAPVQDVMKTMNLDYADMACAAFYDNKYILAIPTGESTYNDTVIEYDTIKQTFIVKRGICINDFVEFNNKLLFCDSNSSSSENYVYQYDTGTTYNNEPIEAYWETPYTDLDSPDSTKTSTYIYGTFQGTGQVKVDAIFDDKIKSVLIDLPSTPKVLKKRIRNKGRRFKFKFSNVNGSSFSIINPKILIDIDSD